MIIFNKIKTPGQIVTPALTDAIPVEQADGSFGYETLSQVQALIGGGGGGGGVTISTVASDTVIADGSDNLLIFIDASSNTVDVTMPTLSANLNREIEVFVIDDTFLSRFIGEAAETIGGMNIIELPVAGNRVKSIGQTSEWQILSENISCSLQLNTYAGFGSTDTKIMQLTNAIQDIGNVFTNNHGSYGTAGLEITINKTGRYTFQYSSDADAAGSTHVGFSLNSAQLTTGIVSITLSDRIALGISGTGGGPAPSVSIVLEVGDVVRLHTEGAAIAQAARCHFSASYGGA